MIYRPVGTKNTVRIRQSIMHIEFTANYLEINSARQIRC